MPAAAPRRNFDTVTAAPERGTRERSAVVDATMELAATHAYARLTVAEIAAAAGMAPSDFFRYFPGKDAVVLSVLQDLLAAAAAHLPTIVHDDPRHALHAANAAMLQDVIEGRGTVSTANLTGMAAAVTASAPLQRRASALRQQVMGRALAHHLHLEPADRRVRAPVVAWSAVVAASYHADLGRSGSSVGSRSSRDRIAPERMSRRLDTTFRRILGRAPALS